MEIKELKRSDLIKRKQNTPLEDIVISDFKSEIIWDITIHEASVIVDGENVRILSNRHGHEKTMKISEYPKWEKDFIYLLNH